MTGTEVNQNKSVYLRYLERRIDGLVKLRGSWFSPHARIKKNFSKVTDRMTSLSKTRSRRRLSLKGHMEVVQVFISSVITYHLTVDLQAGKNTLPLFVGAGNRL